MTARPTADWHAAPVLSGRVVRLEPIGPGHVDGLVAAADDDEVFAHLSHPRLRTADDAATLVAQAVRRHLAGEAVTWVQVALDGADAPTVAGATSFYDIDPARRALAIGSTWLGRRWWRTGLNTEAKLLLLRRAFDELGAVRVVWHVDVRNARSQAAVTRLGAVREGVLRKHKQRRDGSWRDTVLYAMTDDDWPATRDRLSAMASTERGRSTARP